MPAVRVRVREAHSVVIVSSRIHHLILLMIVGQMWVLGVTSKSCDMTVVLLSIS